jgi:hypothetical protein
MSGLGEHFPEFQKGAGAAVTPNDIDRYELYQIINPMIGTDVLGTAEGTQTTVVTGAFNTIIPDYPRSVTVSIVGASGSTTGGTIHLVGKNQFGEVISEDLGCAAAANGGTAAGTKVFAYFTSMTGTMATSNAGVGTSLLIPSVTGTTALFGLPTKIGGSTDIKMMTFGSTGIAKSANGGTLGAYANLTQHAIKAPNTVTTAAANPTWINVWYKSSWRNSQKPDMAGL